MKTVTFLDNPPRGARRVTKRRNAPKHAAARRGHSKRKPPAGYKTWAAFMDHLRSMKKGKGRTRKNPATRGKAMAKKRKHHARANPPRKAHPHHKRKHYGRRSNPPAFGKLTRYASRPGPVGFAIRTVGRAGVGIAGEVFVRKVRGTVFKQAPGTIVGSAIEALLGLATGYAISFAHEGAGAAWAQGAVAAPLRTELQQMAIPHVSDSLGDDGYVMGPGTGVTLISAFPDDYAGVVQGEDGDATLGQYMPAANSDVMGAYVAGSINAA